MIAEKEDKTKLLMEEKDKTIDILKQQYQDLENRCRRMESVLVCGILPSLKNKPTIHQIEMLCPNAPELKAPDKEVIKDMIIGKRNIYDVAEQIIHLYADDTSTAFFVYVTKLIVRYYKKDNPLDQSFWNADTARNNYMTRNKTDDGDLKWKDDKKGIRTKVISISPFLEVIRDIFLIYIGEHSYICQKDTRKVKDINELNEIANMQWVISRMYKVNTEIELKNFDEKIISCMGAYFKFDPDVVLNYIKNGNMLEYKEENIQAYDEYDSDKEMEELYKVFNEPVSDSEIDDNTKIKEIAKKIKRQKNNKINIQKTKTQKELDDMVEGYKNNTIDRQSLSKYELKYCAKQCEKNNKKVSRAKKQNIES